MNSLAAIILAAGRGTRMQATDKNKVALEVNGKPMIVRTIEILQAAGIEHIVTVVGFAKESVISLLPKNIIVAEQTEQLGTGHAVMSAIPKVPNECDNVLIINGDDSFLYTPETFQNFYREHKESQAKITFISMESDEPTGFGRILRNENGEIVGIVEEKNADLEQRKIKEINLGCYIIDKKYLEENIKFVKKNELTGEYYITDIIDIISMQKGKIASYKLTGGRWRGVNTKEDLQQAETFFS